MSPLLWPTGHSNQPPTYFLISGADVLRDEALIYESILREEGVKTKFYVAPGLPHAGANFFTWLPAAKKGIEEREEGFRWLVNQK